MNARSFRSRVVAVAALLFTAGAGCSLIVSGDVPEFQCDGTSASSCPSGQTCDLSTHKCTSADGSAVDPDTGDQDVVTDDVRDGASESDAPQGPADLGGQCRLDKECKSNLCATATILTAPVIATTGPICTTPCCTSNECPSSFVCFGGGTGGSYCVPKALAQRTPPASGGLLGGATCATNSQCRSGLCTGTPKTCLDTCCAQTDCNGTSACRIKSVPAPTAPHDIWVCAAPESGSTGNPGDTCANQTDCKSDFCTPVGAGGRCRPTCSSTNACHLVSGFASGHCIYSTSNGDAIRYCLATTFTSGTAAGGACTGPGDCQSDFCDPETKKCATVCARDEDCLPSEACKPSAPTPLLRCVPKP